MKNLILSVQHLLAMYAGAILVPIIVGTSLKFTPEQIARKKCDQLHSLTLHQFDDLKIHRLLKSSHQ